MGKRTNNLILHCLNEVILNSQRQIMSMEKLNMKLSELATTLNAVNAQLVKALEEIKTQVATLNDALVNTEIPSAAEEALVALMATTVALDDLNPDAAPVQPDTPTPVDNAEV